jgi:transcriptional regulator with XRE-family HTH domain
MSKISGISQASFANRVKTLREQNSLTASDLAKLAHVSPAAVSNWEKNGTIPRPATVQTIADGLGVSPAFLLTGENDVTHAAPEPRVEIAKATSSTRALKEATLEELLKAIEDKGFAITLEFGGSNRR